jgi:23S rRNA (cytidine1920-2'-O)/16S rRNA (cytidine1409-2'-O)-methyltransferase
MSKSNHKQRLDLLLFQRSLAESRSHAQALIMEGVVYVNGQKADKPGTSFKSDVEIDVKKSSMKYVSRGGLKLEAALEYFEIDVSDKIALDIGASTGGFTDCLLQNGAKKVYAVDVGYGQLDWKLRNDSRIVSMEKVNARHMKAEDIPESIDIIVMDVSFISLTKIITAVIQFLKPGGMLIALIKPQFEVGKGEVGKGGIIRDENKHNEVINKIKKYVQDLDFNFNIRGVIPSPILGTQGNKEFLIVADRSG